MKKTGIVVTILLLLGSLFIPWNNASAATDGFYNLSETTSTWDGTDANRTKATSSDYDYSYGDEGSVTYNLPWDFTFYGVTYNQIVVDVNGYIRFAASSSGHSFNLATTGMGPVIAPWNNDLSSYYYGGVFVQHKTNPERVVIEWQTETYTEEGFYLPNTLEAVIYQTGRIRFDYKSFATQAGKDFGSGISNGNGTHLSVTSLYANTYTMTGRSFSFINTSPFVTVDAGNTVVKTASAILTGSMAPGATITVTANTTATIGQVTYPTSGTWSCTVSNLIAGQNTFTVTAIDADGNQNANTVDVIYQNGFDIAVSPTSMDADQTGGILLEVSNIPIHGGEVLIEQFVDANRNGIIDNGDYVVRSFKIADGTSSSDPGVPGDEDGTANGMASVTLSSYLIGDIFHTPASYIFRAGQGASAAIANLTVTPLNQPQSISGGVGDGTNAHPGAMVRLTDTGGRHLAFAVADEAGHYTLNIPTPGSYLLTPMAYAHASPSPTPVTLTSGQVVVDQDLTLVPGSFQIIGRIKDEANGAGIPGVWVWARGQTASGVAISDANGNYKMFLPAGQYSLSASTDPAEPSPYAKGYMAFGKLALVVNLIASSSGNDITLPKASILMNGLVLDQTANTLPGIPVTARLSAAADAREPLVSRVADLSGNFTFPLSAGEQWTIALNSPYAALLNLIGTTIRDYSTTTGPTTGNNITTRPVTAWVEGVVKDSGNTLLSGIEVVLRNADSSVMASTLSSADGTYRIGAYAGNWFVNAAVTEQPVTLEDEQTATLNFVVTRPTVTIAPYTGSDSADSLTITGTMEAGTTVSLSVDTGAQTGTITYPTATTWTATITGMTTGENKIKAIATDASGNTTSTEFTVTACYQPVRIARSTPVYFTSLQAAYDAAVNGDVIQARWQIPQENLNANRNIAVTIDGGYTCNYSTNPDNTILKGPVIFRNGTVTIKNINLLN